MSTPAPPIFDFPSWATFTGRLDWLLAGRKKTPWGRALGMGAGTLDAMTREEGVPPTADFLIRIQRAEHVSLSWLLTGQGAPFLVTTAITDDEAASYLEAWLSDETSWRALLIEDGARLSVVLYQQVWVSDRKGDYDYTAMEILVGALGQNTLHILADRAGERGISILHLSGTKHDEFRRGRWGTYRLFGGKSGGEFHNATPISYKAPNQLDAYFRLSIRVAEAPVPYGSEEAKIIAAWPLLEEQERTALNVVLQPMLERATMRKAKP